MFNRNHNMSSMLTAICCSSDSPFVMDIIHRVQEQGVNFKDAIRSSRESAQHGSKFCADFVTLLEVLGDSSISKDEIRDHIQSMWKIANDAHTSAQSAAEMFQVIRHGIYDVIRTFCFLYLLILTWYRSRTMFLER